MAQLYKVDRHVLGHLDSNEFRIDTRVSTKEIKKDYFNMIDSNLSIFYCNDIRVNYHKIASNSVQRDYKDYGKIVDIDNNIKAIQIVAGNGRNGILNRLIYVQSVLRRGNLDEVSKKISILSCEEDEEECIARILEKIYNLHMRLSSDNF